MKMSPKYFRKYSKFSDFFLAVVTWIHLNTECTFLSEPPWQANAHQAIEGKHAAPWPVVRETHAFFAKEQTNCVFEHETTLFGIFVSPPKENDGAEASEEIWMFW